MLNYCGIDPDSLLSLNGIIDRTGSEIRHVNYKYPQVPEGQKESFFSANIRLWKCHCKNSLIMRMRLEIGLK